MINLDKIFIILDKWFRFVLLIQKKIIEHIDFFEKLKKYKKLYTIIVFIIMLLTLRLKINFNYLTVIIIFIFIIEIGINFLDIISSARTYFKYWFILILFLPTTAYIYLEYMLDEIIILQWCIFLLILTISATIINSFIDGKVAMLVNGSFIFIHDFVSEIGKIFIKIVPVLNEYFKEERIENIEFLFSPIRTILIFLTFFAVLKEYWIYKYNDGKDFLDLLKENK